MANIITTDTKARRFDPSQGYFRRMTFVVTTDNENTLKADIAKLKSVIEQTIVDFVPAHERKYVTRRIKINKAPEESWIRWDYDPPRKVK